METGSQAFFEGFADKHRLKIVKLLLAKDMNVTEICSHFSMRQPSVSHHLSIMRKGGVLKTERRGKEIIYSINREGISSSLSSYFADFGLNLKNL